MATFYRNHVALDNRIAVSTPATYTSNKFRVPPGGSDALVILEITAITGAASLDLFVDTSPDGGATFATENAGTKINAASYTAVGNYAVAVGPGTTNNGVVFGDMNVVRVVTTGTGTVTYKLILLTEDTR